MKIKFRYLQKGQKERKIYRLAASITCVLALGILCPNNVTWAETSAQLEGATVVSDEQQTVGKATAAKTQKGKSASLDDFYLDEVVVTARRIDDPRSIYKENANITVIDQQKIEQMHYTNVEEALRTTPGLDFLNYGLQGYNLNSVRINGSDDIIILVDGVRASATGMGNLAQLSMTTNMENVERIEILRGANAVRFGSDAKGGVINIVTKKAKENKTTISRAGGFYNKEQYKIAHEGGDDKFHYRLYGEKYLQGDTRDGHGVVTPGSTDYKNKGIKLDAVINDKSAIGVNWNKQNNNFSFYDWIYAQDCFGQFNTQEWNINYTYNFDDKTYNAFSYRYNDYDHHSQEYWPYGLLEFFTHKYTTRSFRDQITRTIDDNHTISLGYEETETVDRSMKFPVKAGFFTHEWTFDKKWDMNWGLRYDKVTAGFNDFDPKTSKSMTIGHKFDKNNKAYVAYNDYFVMPSIWELWANMSSALGWKENKVYPETGHNYEMGYTHNFDNNTVVSMHYFNRKSKDAAGFDSQKKRYTNFDEQSRGWDVKLDKQWKEAWHFKLGVSKINLDDQNSASFMGLPGIMRGYLPKYTTNIGVEYVKDKWDVGLDGRRFLDRAGKWFNPSGWPTSNYWVWNLGINYKPDKNTKLFMKVNNLFDQYYAEQTQVIWGVFPNRDPKQWYAMPGRNITVGMEYNF